MLEFFPLWGSVISKTRAFFTASFLRFSFDHSYHISCHFFERFHSLSLLVHPSLTFFRSLLFIRKFLCQEFLRFSLLSISPKEFENKTFGLRGLLGTSCQSFSAKVKHMIGCRLRRMLKSFYRIHLMTKATQ